METVKTAELAKALNLTKKTVLEKARMGGWAYVEKGNQMLWIENRLPSDIRFAVAVYKGGLPVGQQVGKTVLPAVKRNEPVANAFINSSKESQETATWRAALIAEYFNSKQPVQAFLEVYNLCDGYPALKSHLGEVTQSTFYRWLKSWKENGASGVTPKYGSSRGGAGESLLEEERDLLRLFWLKSTQPSALHAWRLMKENLPYSKCTYQTALRYLNAIPKGTAGYYRGGAGRFENSYLPYMEQDISRYRSMEVVVSDHHCLDCVVMYKGELVRPWLTTFQDLRSGKVVGFCPCIKPSSYSIVVAYYMCCMRYGIPQGVLFDNGKDYHSKWLTGHTEKVKVFDPEGFEREQEVEFQGLFALVGSSVRFTRTYNGKSKARQERYFRIIGEYLAKEMGTYVGSDSRSRPEEAALMWRAIDHKDKRTDIPSFEQFCQSAEAMIEYINDNIECSSDYMDNKTRSQVFAECLPPEEERRWATKEVLQKALLKGEVRKVGRNGVKIDGLSYYSNQLFEFIGRKIQVYRNLSDTEEITCLTLSGDYICTANANYFKETGYLDRDIARLEGERQRLTQIAIAGSGQVNIAPEFNTMVEVAQRAYQNRQIEQLDNFLEYNSDTEKEKSPAVQKTKKSNLVNPLDGFSEYVREA